MTYNYEKFLKDKYELDFFKKNDTYNKLINYLTGRRNIFVVIKGFVSLLYFIFLLILIICFFTSKFITGILFIAALLLVIPYIKYLNSNTKKVKTINSVIETIKKNTYFFKVGLYQYEIERNFEEYKKELIFNLEEIKKII